MHELSARWDGVPGALRRRWLAVGSAGGLALAMWYLLAPASWYPPAGWLLSTFLWSYLWLTAGWHLDRHRKNPAAPIYAQLGLGNGLTLARGWLLAILGGYLLGSPPANFGLWLPMLAYTASDVADYFDGYLARRQGLESGLGEALDLELDSMGLLLAVWVAVRLGALPWWFILFGLARYGFTSMIRVRRHLGLAVYELPPSKIRRPLAGLSMGYVSASLWPILDQPELTLAGVMFLTPFSFSFLRDGLVVGGWLDPEAHFYRLWRDRLRWFVFGWLPIVFRVGVLLLLLVEVPRLLAPTEPGLLALPSGFVLRVFALVTAFSTLAMVLGWAARFAAFIEVFPLGLTIGAASLDWPRAIALVCVVGILMLGSGRASLWQPSDRVFGQRAGEERTNTAAVV